MYNPCGEKKVSNVQHLLASCFVKEQIHTLDSIFQKDFYFILILGLAQSQI